MKRMRVCGWRLLGLFVKSRRERELADELDGHLAMHIDDGLRAGLTREEARRRAILKLGGSIEPAKESYRDGGTIPLIESALRDARFAIRQLRKTPGFTITAVLMLAIGLCASVTLFAFVDAALIKPLPYPEPTRLVHVTETTPLFPRGNLSYADYLDWKRMNKVFRSLEAYTGTDYLLHTPAGTEPVSGMRVSDGFFRTLGTRPMLGRDFYKGEDLAGTPKTAILSYAAWQKRFGGAKDVVGRTIRLSDTPFTLVGVLPDSFHFAAKGNVEIWTTLHASGVDDLRRSFHNLDGIARLREGVTVKAALANMTSIAKQLEKQYPDSNRDQGANVLPLSEDIVGPIRPIVLALLGGGLLLLLIAAVNVASLLLARSEGRRRELAVRSSLGASSLRLMTQFATEASVLMAAASALGLLLADLAIKLLLGLIPADMMAGMPYLRGLGLNRHVGGFAALVVLFATVLFSTIPSLHLRLSKTREGLTEGTRGSAGRAWRRLGANLVMLELAIAMVLLVGAGLLAQSLNRLLHVELGFAPDRLATMSVAAPDARYTKDEQIVALGRQIVDRAAMLPGVQSVALAGILPVSFNGDTDWIRFVGRPYHGEHNEVNQRDVSAGYFGTIRARLLRGRYFTDSEDASKPRVAIINETLAKKFYPRQDALGKQFGDDDLSPKSMRQIIGIVSDVHEGSLDSPVWPAEYLPFNQGPAWRFSVVVRTAQSAQSVLPAMHAAIRRIDPEVGIADEATMAGRINASPSAYLHRASAWLVSGFAALALLLGVVGLYGVVAYSVSQRTREIGIRMALGAERRGVYRLILGEAGRLTVGGLAGGLVCSLATASLIRKLLFGVSSWDVPTLLIVSLVLGGSALLASYVPARRAAAVNPVEALRAE